MSIVWGILLILSGLVALAAPAATSLGVTVVLAWILMVVGITYVLSTFHAHTFGAIVTRALVGLLYFLVGVAVYRYPLMSVAGLTMIIGVVFLAEGLIAVVTYFTEDEHSTMQLLSGVVSLILGAMIWNQFPSSALWLIGTLVGINLIFAGFTQVTLAFGEMRFARYGHV